MVQISRTILLVAFVYLGVVGCATTSTEIQPKSEVPYQRVFNGTFDEVWRATAVSMSRYPLSINNMNLGNIETEEIKGSEMWHPPYLDRPLSSGLRYRLLIRVIKGKQAKKPAIRVTVIKDIKLYRDFFSEPEPVQSDGIEEATILYRIQRELEIDELRKANIPERAQPTGQPEQ